MKNWLIGKDSDAGRDWGQEEKGTTEDEMAGWHHWLDGHESRWTPGVGDGQGGLSCCDSWGRKESDTTERLIWRLDMSCSQHNMEDHGTIILSKGVYYGASELGQADSISLFPWRAELHIPNSMVPKQPSTFLVHLLSIQMVIMILFQKLILLWSKHLQDKKISINWTKMRITIKYQILQL